MTFFCTTANYPNRKVSITPQSPLAIGWCDGIGPPPEIPLREWVCEHVYLPNSPEGARYSLDAVPAHAIIWDWIEDPAVKEIAVVACVGFGKTAIFEAWNVRIVAVEPADTMAIGQTDKMVKDWMEGRMRKTWEMSPASSSYIPRGRQRNDWKKDSVIFGSMNFYAAAANVTSTQEKSMVNIQGDEVWRWDDGLIDYALKRHHGRWNRKSLLMSQGGTEDGQWHKHARGGKMHDLEHICPKCSTGSVFDWGNFQYEVIRDGNDELDWPAIFASVRLKCPHCGEQYEDTEFNRRQWAKCRPVWDGGNYIPERMTLRASFMSVWRYSWASIVKEWIQANEEKKSGSLANLENIICQRFAQFWKPPSDAPTLSLQGDPYGKAEYHDGQKWELEDFRFLTVDVQKGHFWAVIRAWKIGGASRLLWEGRLETWDNIRYLQERYVIENRFVFVDCGYQPEEVAKQAHASMTSKDLRPWNLVRGEDTRDGYLIIVGERKFRRVYSDLVKSVSSAGLPYRFIKASNLLCKDRLAALMTSPDFGVPVDASKQYHAQMQSEQKREISPGIWRWEPLKKGMQANNHMFDCEVLQVVAASIFKVLVSLEEIRKD